MHSETAQPLPLERLIHMLKHNSATDPYLMLHSIRIVRCPTLAHILAIILHPPQTTATQCFPEKDTGVLVIDNLSTPFSIAFPPGIDGDYSWRNGGKDTSGRGGKPQVPPSVRRLGILADLATGLGKLAVSRNIAVCLSLQ